MLARLVMQSAAFDHEVVSLTSLGLVSETLKSAGIPVSSLGMKARQLDPLALVRLRRNIQKRKATILQTWMCHADLVGTLASQGTGAPVIWNLRNCYDRHSSHFVPMLCARLSSKPAVVIANSHAGRASYEAIGYRPSAWKVIPNGFDLDRFAPDADAPLRVKPRLRISPTDFAVAMVARRHAMKDHEAFLKAADIVRRVVPNVRFILVGAGLASDEGLTHSIDTMGLRECVFRLGLQTDVQSLLQGMDLAVSSSRTEGLPNAVGEAMSCGVPCVATDVGDSARLIGASGVVVPPSNHVALAHAIIRVLQLPPESRAELGRQARERIVDNYSLARAIREYEELYAEIGAKLA
jgi:glycosyltransferase involved in cell wall biosynthesis